MSAAMSDLTEARCSPSGAGLASLNDGEITTMLGRVKGWIHRDGVITKQYSFQNYLQTMAFVNATAWISCREDHHPELTVGYNTCRVDYCTHAVKGISVNDFICAAKLDALFEL